MRVGKKPNVVKGKKPRSCVVRSEKVAKESPPASPTLESSQDSTVDPNHLSATDMRITSKGRRGAATSQQNKFSKGPIKKRPVGSSSGNSNSNLETPELKSTSANMSNVKSNQKIKVIPRSNKSTPVSTPSRDETPPPTIAAGRSRRAIKPNPKYASEDMVTPKVVRNVALASSTNRGSGGGSTAQSGNTSKSRKVSSSSDDFYNRNTEDEFEDEINEEDDDNDLHNDKSYQANEKDQRDSDFSDIEEKPVRVARPRGRPRRNPDPTVVNTQQTTNKSAQQTPLSNVKRTATANSANLRSAPSQLQQIRRSLASANNQRNVLASSSSTAQKRKLEESQYSSDNDSDFSITRKQLILSNSAGHKVKVPVRENKVNVNSAHLTKSRALGMQKVSQNLTPQHDNTSSSRRVIEMSAKSNTELTSKTSVRGLHIRQSAATAFTNQNNKAQNSVGHQQSPTTQTKIFAARTGKVRSGSPKLTTQRETHISTTSTHCAAGNSSLNNSSKLIEKSKSISSQNLSSMASIKKRSSSSPSAASSEKTLDLKDDSPNSTIDDFETMPTFTIVNVNDIINKKGDVLITKSKNSNKTPTIIEFSESVSLDGDEDEDHEVLKMSTAPSPNLTTKKFPKLPTLSNRKEFENKKFALARSNESLRRSQSNTTSSSNTPQILNHKLGLRNSRVTPKTTTTLRATLMSPNKPAPRILNSVVAKKTQPVKPMIANMDDSADESFPLSLDEDEEEETEDEIVNKNRMSDDRRERKQMDVDTEDAESQNTEENDTMVQKSASISPSAASLTPRLSAVQQRRRRLACASNNPIVVSSNKKKMTPAVAKENSLAATNQLVYDSKQSTGTTLTRKPNAEKVVISKQGDKIIKKITCYETWYVINMPLEPKRQTVIKNQLEMPLIQLANNAKIIGLPTDLWSCKVTLYELSPQTLSKGTFVTYTGDLTEHNISEEDRGKYQPSCVMFRRSIEKNQVSRMPYDRAVIFKNKTFYTNIEGKNVRLIGAPSIINSESEIEILLEVVDALTLQSEFVEHISIVQ